MRVVASAESWRGGSTSCCQCCVISEDLHKPLCGMCPFSSFDIFFPFLILSVLVPWSLESAMPFSSQERRGQALSQHEQQVVGHHFGTRLVLFNPPVHRSHQHAHQQMGQQHRTTRCNPTL